MRHLHEFRLVDLVVVAQREPEQVTTAHRSGRELSGSAQLQADDPPIAHGKWMKTRAHPNHTESYGVGP
jgi:hypothetical protein